MADRDVSFASAYASDPARMSIANITTGEAIDAQFNPTEFDETITPVYARLAVQGLSHQVTQYSYTENLKIAFTLFFLSTDGGQLAAKAIRRSKNFLASLCYPRGVAGTVKSGGAPRALFVWPEEVSIECVVTGLKFNNRRMNILGRVCDFTAAVQLEELRRGLITSEQVFLNGHQRTPGG